MKVTTFGKAGLSFATAFSLSLALGVSTAHAVASPPTATQEDPSAAAIGSQTLVGAGSDTIQDVEYGISRHLGTYDGTHLKLASWTATGESAMSYRSGGHPAVATAHPNGSGAGFTVLKESIGAQPLSGTDGVALGDVDYSRASGFQGNEQTNQTGVVTEIPFAIDAISFAAPGNSPFLLTNNHKGLTLADLANIYGGVDKYVDTTTGALSATATATTLPIQAFVPKPGSGSRQFFLKQLHAVNSGAVAYGSDKGDSDFASAGAPVEYAPANGSTPAVEAQPYVGAEMPGGGNVQEHDASVLVNGAVDPTKAAAIAPFSAAKFIGYHNQLIADPSNKVAGSDYVLVPFDSAIPGSTPATGSTPFIPGPGTPELPYTESNGAYVPNTSYATNGIEGSATLTREVFNIIPTAAVNFPSANDQFKRLNAMFVGVSSLFCTSDSVIQAYGFMTDPICGDTSRTANTGGSDASSGYQTSTATATMTPAVAGKSTNVTVNVIANGTPGGSVTVVIGGVKRTATIAKGATSITFSVPTPNAGTFSLAAGTIFVPNLAGDAAAPITSAPVRVSKAIPTVRATAPRVSHRAIAKVKVTVTATGLTPTGRVTVVIQKGTKKITRTVTLSRASATAQFGKLAKGKYTVYVSYSGSSNVSAKAKTRLATLTVF